MEKIIFYTTDACSLCETALSMVRISINKLEQQLILIDIIDDDYLIETYGDKIPAIYRENTASHLYWPFSPVDVQNFLL